MNIESLKKEFANCPCGRPHDFAMRAAEIGSGVTADAGRILRRNSFGNRLLLVADKNTLAAADGLLNVLDGFNVNKIIYENLRKAEMKEVERIEQALFEADGVLAVGTGSIHDICRLAAARQSKPLALFATAASMDGFASDSAPIITDNGFKSSYAAKTPEVVIADTRILARAPVELKAAGFGDMTGKYIGLIDWKVSHLVSGEYYCGKVAGLTRRTADGAFALAGVVTGKDEAVAGQMVEYLLLTGAGMSFVKNTRPASGTEHILSHFWECTKLLKGELPDFHGRDVGVATLLVKREYEHMAMRTTVKAHGEINDWEKIFGAFGALRGSVEKLNIPHTVTDDIDPRMIEAAWGEIRKTVADTPSYQEIYDALKTAGCPVTPDEVGVSGKLLRDSLKYHPYMRSRLSLYRLKNMIDLFPIS